MSRARYLVLRSLQTVVLLWAILTFLFFFFRLMPGSFVDIMMYQGASPEAVAAFKQKWGLDEPLYVQYWNYLMRFLQLDLGTSLQFRQPVWEYVKMRIFNTFLLVAPGITVAYLIGTLIGTVQGVTRGSVFERYSTIPVIMVGTFPLFFTSIVLIIVFAQTLNWFPTSGMMSSGIGRFSENAAWWRPYLTVDFLKHYTLPFVAVILRFLYLPSLVMRGSVLDVLGQDFIEYHRITGLSKAVRYRHIMKHSFLPVITLYPAAMVRALGGLVLVETVFNWPGIGAALVQAVIFRDFPVVQFVFFLTATWVILANYAVDVLYSVVDPRVSLSSSEG
jgi:peptide/nickel transport system permease protein